MSLLPLRIWPILTMQGSSVARMVADTGAEAEEKELMAARARGEGAADRREGGGGEAGEGRAGRWLRASDASRREARRMGGERERERGREGERERGNCYH